MTVSDIPEWIGGMSILQGVLVLTGLLAAVMVIIFVAAAIEVSIEIWSSQR